MSTTDATIRATIFGRTVRGTLVDSEWTPRFNAQDDRRITLDVDGVRFVVGPEDLCDPTPDDAPSCGRGDLHRSRTG